MICRYRVVIERDESGAWLARVPSVPGCHTHGRTLEEARRPRGAREAPRRSLADRERVESARAAAGLSTAQAVRTLLEELHLSVRDAGELLGLSHQRVQQLARRQRARHEAGPHAGAPVRFTP